MQIVQGLREHERSKIEKRIRYVDRRVKEVLAAEKWEVKKGELRFETARVKFNKYTGWFEMTYTIKNECLEFGLDVEFRACSTPIKLRSHIQDDKVVAECRSKKDFNKFWASLESVMENDLALTILDGYIRDAVKATTAPYDRSKIDQYELRYDISIDCPKISQVRNSNSLGYGYSVRSLHSISVLIDFDSSQLKVSGPQSIKRDVSIGDPNIVKTLTETLDEVFETAVQKSIDSDFVDKFELRNADDHLKRMKFICDTLERRPNTKAVLDRLASFRRQVESF